MKKWTLYITPQDISRVAFGGAVVGFVRAALVFAFSRIVYMAGAAAALALSPIMAVVLAAVTLMFAWAALTEQGIYVDFYVHRGGRSVWSWDWRSWSFTYWWYIDAWDYEGYYRT